MFGFVRMVPEQPTPIIPNIPSKEQVDEYLKLQEKHNTGNKAALRYHIMRFMHENNINIYDNQKVDHYLSALVRKELGMFYRWIWKAIDENKNDLTLITSNRHGNIYSGGGIYSEQIPLEILRKVQLLEKEFPKLRFYVSDYVHHQDHNMRGDLDDPFIMCTLHSMDYIVFGVWNEPEFK